MKVFLIDDDPKTLVVVSKMLQSENIEGAFSLGTSDDLLTTIKEFSPDIIVLDLYMPNFCGVEVFKKIKALEGYEDIPIIALSSTQDLDDRVEVLKAGFNQFMLKPVDKNKLIQSLKTQVGLSYLIQQCEEAIESMEDY